MDAHTSLAGWIPLPSRRGARWAPSPLVTSSVPLKKSSRGDSSEEAWGLGFGAGGTSGGYPPRGRRQGAVMTHAGSECCSRQPVPRVCVRACCSLPVVVGLGDGRSQRDGEAVSLPPEFPHGV